MRQVLEHAERDAREAAPGPDEEQDGDKNGDGDTRLEGGNTAGKAAALGRPAPARWMRGG